MRGPRCLKSPIGNDKINLLLSTHVIQHILFVDAVLENDEVEALLPSEILCATSEHRYTEQS